MFFFYRMTYFWSAIVMQRQQNNDFPDEISFVDLNKIKGKRIYNSGPGKILWVCTDYIDFAEEKSVKKTQNVRAQKMRFFQPLKTRLQRKLKALYIWSPWTLGVNSSSDLATGCLSTLLNIMRIKFSSMAPGVSLLAAQLMVCNRWEAVIFIPPLITRSLLWQLVCECDGTSFYHYIYDVKWPQN